MFDDGERFTNDEIVIDPEVPAPARRGLVARHQRESRRVQWRAAQAGEAYPGYAAGQVTPAGQSGSGAPVNPALSGQLVPFREPAPQAPVPPAPATVQTARTWGVFALAFFIGTLVAAVAGSVGFVVLLLIATAIATTGAVRSLFSASGKSQTWTRQQWEIRHAAVRWHRHYVVPQTDLDDEARPVWTRAVAAANEIREADVVQQHIVDSVQVAAALPQRLWEIAEGFAVLSQARGRQQEILGQGGADRLIAAKVRAQEREMRALAKRLEGRVRRLEEIAVLLRNADAAKRSEMMLGQLGDVDSLLVDLRARSSGPPSDLDPTEQLRLDAEAIIEQANEAARDLALPGLGEEDGDEETDGA